MRVLDDQTWTENTILLVIYQRFRAENEPKSRSLVANSNALNFP